MPAGIDPTGTHPMSEDESRPETRLYRLRVLRAALAALAAALTLWKALCAG